MAEPDISLPFISSKKEVLHIGVDEFLDNKEAVKIDVRSSAEFEKGHIEGAYNIPLFTNEERAVVGTIYKKIGKTEAIIKGLEFVGPKMSSFVKEARKLSKEKKVYVYCWRGGMRSNSMAWLFNNVDLEVSVLNGGYKAFRAEFDTLVDKSWNFISILGSTGCGKTELLKELEDLGEQILDLEGMANHKGSVFGGLGKGSQPSTEEFINRIHLKLRSMDPQKPIWVEGESIMIGSCFIPQNLFQKLLTSQNYNVTMPLEQRIKRLSDEYGSFDVESVVAGFTKVEKRMGYDNAKFAKEAFIKGDVTETVKIALQYYDKGYSEASKKRTGKNLGEFTLYDGCMKEGAQQLVNDYYKHQQL